MDSDTEDSETEEEEVRTEEITDGKRDLSDIQEENDIPSPSSVSALCTL